MLALGKLETRSGAALPVFFPLFFPGVPLDEPGSLQHLAKVRIHLEKRPGNTVPHGFGLPEGAAALDVDLDIVVAAGVGQLERLPGHPASGFQAEIVLDGFVIDDDFALAGLEPGPCDCCLTFARGVKYVFSFHSSPAILCSRLY